MAYTTIDDPSVYFQTVLWSGDNSDSRNITNDGNSDLQPDWVWIKSRNGSGNGYSHNVHDTSRGVDSNINKSLFPDVTDTEGGGDSVTTSAQLGGVSAMLSDGFTVKEGNTDDARYVNKSSNTYVAWQWKANGGSTTTNDASATSVGTIDSVYQANTTAGFSIVTHTGTGSAGTIAHGLGAVPKWMLIKRRTSSTENWCNYHASNTSAPATDVFFLNNTEATADTDSVWNDTDPTSTVFSVKDGGAVNESGGTYVTYLFAEKQGYSKFGSYTGNANADGPFVYLGFKPAFVIIKNTSAAKDWTMWDTTRYSNNVQNVQLFPNLSNAEDSPSTSTMLDMLSNGFKIRGTNDKINGSGNTLLYMAFAENPFVSSEGVPVTAR